MYRRSITLTDLKANIYPNFIHQDSKRLLRVETGDLLSTDKKSVKVERPGIFKDNQVFWHQKLQLNLGSNTEIRFYINQTSKQGPAIQNSRFEGALNLKPREKPVSLKLIQLFINEIKVGTLTFRLLLNQISQEQAERQQQIIRHVNQKFDFSQAGGRVIIYGISVMVKETYFNISGRDALIKIIFGRHVEKTNICKKMGPTPGWKQQLKLSRDSESRIKFHLVLLQMPQKKQQQVAWAELNLQQIGNQMRYISFKIELKDSKGRGCGHLELDIRLVTREQQRQVADQLEKGEKKSLARKRLQNLLIQGRQQHHYKNRQNSVSMAAMQPKKYNVMKSNGSIIIPRSQRFISTKDNSITHNVSDIHTESDSPKKRSKKYHGAAIGFGERIDFTKQNVSPGVGRYKLPSIFD